MADDFFLISKIKLVGIFWVYWKDIEIIKIFLKVLGDSKDKFVFILVLFGVNVVV